jgi:hypothetical protein
MAPCGSSFSDFLGCRSLKFIYIVGRRKRVSRVEMLNPSPMDRASSAIRYVIETTVRYSLDDQGASPIRA